MNLSRPVSSSSSSSSDPITPAHIHEVHLLIEKCLMFHMDREECIESLETCANVKPAVTRTVWDELEKANSEFFRAYNLSRQSGRRQSSSHEDFVNENSSIIRKGCRDTIDKKDS